MKDRIAQSIFWMTWSKGIVQVLSFLSTILVARLLNPSDYGLMALAGIWTHSLGLLAEMGLGSAIVQFRDLDRGELNACFWLTMGAAGTAYLALYAAAPTVAVWFNAPRLCDILRVASISMLLIAVRLVPDSLLRKRLALDKVAQAEMVSVLVTIPAVIVMAWHGAGVWALVVGVLLLSLVQTLTTFWFVRWWPGFYVGGKRIREVLLFSAAALGAKAGWAVYEQTDSFVLGKVSGELVVGFYSMARQLATLPISKISVWGNQLATPIMAELQADVSKMRSSFLRALRLVACLTLPLCAGMALVAEDFILAVLTEKWLSAVPLLQLLCLCALFRSLEVMLPPLLLARYRATFLFWWTVVVLAVMPFAFWVGARWMGGQGVALAWIGVYPLLMTCMAREALRELEITWRVILLQVKPILKAIFIMGVVVIVIRYLMPGSNTFEQLVRLGVASTVGAITYGLVILWQGDVIVNEIAEVLGWLIRRHRPVPIAK
jgi:O-antigen/teichoic acid export membrane protein